MLMTGMAVSASSVVVLSVCPIPVVADILTGRTGCIVSCRHIYTTGVPYTVYMRGLKIRQCDITFERIPLPGLS